MASHSSTVNGGNDNQSLERPFLETSLMMEQDLRHDIMETNAIETELQEMDNLDILEEEYRKPKDVGKTEEELLASQDLITRDAQELLRMQECHDSFMERLNKIKISMVRFWSSLDAREYEQKTEEARFRREIEEKQFLMEMSKTNKGKALLKGEEAEGTYEVMIELRQSRLQQALTNQELLSELRKKYEDAKKKVDAVSEEQETNLKRLLMVMTAVEWALDAVYNQRRKNAREAIAALNAKEESSSLQEQAAKTEVKEDVEGDTEGETREKADEKPETENLTEEEKTEDEKPEMGKLTEETTEDEKPEMDKLTEEKKSESEDEDSTKRCD